MSPFFIKLFAKGTKCPACKAKKRAGYSMCAEHIEKAKVRWRSWSVQRKHQGRCCYCNNKSFKGWLRCKTHTIINRVKCKAWGKQHPEYSKLSNLKKKRIIAQGRCPQCKPHRKLPKGYTRCWICRKRLWILEMGIKTKTTITKKELLSILTFNHLSVK